MTTPITHKVVALEIGDNVSALSESGKLTIQEMSTYQCHINYHNSSSTVELDYKIGFPSFEVTKCEPIGTPW